MGLLKLAVAGVAAALLCGTAVAADGTSFIASGTGEVVAKPDVAFVTMNFEAKGKTPQAATELDAKTVGEVVKALTRAGVEQRDIQTDNYVIEGIEGPEGCGQYHGDNPIVPCVPDGYRIRDGLTVRIRDLAKYPQVLEAAIAAGLDDISGITLAVADPRPYEDQAYAAALLAARAKAELTAKTLGFKLGAIIDVGANFRDAYATSKPATLKDGMDHPLYGEDAADLGVVTTIQPGELTFSRDASITYQILQEQ